MVKPYMVMWSFKERRFREKKSELKARSRASLEGLVGVVPELIKSRGLLQTFFIQHT